MLQVIEGRKLLMVIGVAKSIEHDYECGFGRTRDEKACGDVGMGCIAGSRDVSTKKVTLPMNGIFQLSK